MELELLNYKQKINKNNESIVDLTKKSIEYKDYNFYILDGFYVGFDIEMRPDLLSHAIYGNNHSWDLILKFNGISNPFSLSHEHFIMVPELSWMNEQLYKENNLEYLDVEDIRSPYIDNTKETKIDNKKSEYDKLVKSLYKVNKNAKFNENILPPNLAQPGNDEITVKNDKIILG